MSDAPNPLEQYTRPEATDPAEIHFRKAWQFRKDKNFKAAADEFSKSLECDPEKPATHFNLALVLDSLKDGERACQHAIKALKLFERDGDISKISTALKLVEKLQKKYSE